MVEKNYHLFVLSLVPKAWQTVSPKITSVGR